MRHRTGVPASASIKCATDAAGFRNRPQVGELIPRAGRRGRRNPAEDISSKPRQLFAITGGV
jgi:hypothetical protein